jgi:BNR/Asp-box repeat
VKGLTVVRCLGLCLVVLSCLYQPSPACAWAIQTQDKATGSSAHDGQRDFDFTLGNWRTRISRLQHPLTGSKTWIHLEGTKVVRKVWEGRGALEEIEADGPAGHWEGLTLFLYNAEAHQWSMNFANSGDGTFNQPAIGEFKNGRGEFYDQEEYKGRSILVRIVWSDIAPNSHRFEQSFSEDGGKTWEPNFVAELTRDEGATVKSSSIQGREPQHDFDWEIGDWKDHVKRLKHPLAGSSEWVELDGTVKTRKVWDGRANLAEIALDGPKGHIEFLSMRLYNPQTHQWNMNFATVGGGKLSVPMFGGFKNGHGEFYDQEPLDGKMILVRFTFSNTSADSGRSEQAFSDDGGKTWEVNWINNYTRIKD